MQLARAKVSGNPIVSKVTACPCKTLRDSKSVGVANCECTPRIQTVSRLQLTRVMLFDKPKCVGVASYECSPRIKKCRRLQLASVKLFEDQKVSRIAFQEYEVARHGVALKYFVRGDRKAHFPDLFGIC